VVETNQSALVPPPSTLVEPLPLEPPSSLLPPAAADAKLDGNCEGIMEPLAGYTHLRNETGVMVKEDWSKFLHWTEGTRRVLEWMRRSDSLEGRHGARKREK
jgi:hypothetical protein